MHSMDHVFLCHIQETLWSKTMRFSYMMTLPPSSLVMGINDMIRFVWEGVQTKEKGIYLPPRIFSDGNDGRGQTPPPSHATVRMLA